MLIGLTIRILRAADSRWGSVKICPFRHLRSCWGGRGGGVSELTPPAPAGHTAHKLDVGGGLCYIRVDMNVSVWRTESKSCSGLMFRLVNNSQQL